MIDTGLGILMIVVSRRKGFSLASSVYVVYVCVPAFQSFFALERLLFMLVFLCFWTTPRSILVMLMLDRAH